MHTPLPTETTEGPEKVEKAETAEAKKELIKEAGMELDDEELEQVAGGCIYLIIGILSDPEGKDIHSDARPASALPGRVAHRRCGLARCDGRPCFRYQARRAALIF